MNWFILALISALLSAASSIFEKKILFTLEALKFSLLLALFNLLFSIPFFFGVDYQTLSMSALVFLYAKTILGALAFWCVMLAIKNMELSGALPLLILTPGLVAFFAFILLGESLSIFEITGMTAMLAGIYILERKDKDIFEPFRIFIKSKSHHYVIAALLLFTITSIADKWLLRDFKLSPQAFIPFQHLFLAFNFILIAAGRKTISKDYIRKVPKDTWKWIVLVSLLTVGYRYAQIETVKIAPVALALTVKRTSVFFTTVIGGRIFREHHLIRKAIATLVMIAGAVIMLY